MFRLLLALFSVAAVVPAQTGWFRLAPTPAPAARAFSAIAFDSMRNRLVLFGGAGDAGALDDTWEFAATWQRATPAVTPPARHGHALAFDANRNRVVLFGGLAGSRHLDDTWEWDGANWRAIATPNAPSPREGHALAWDPRRQRVLLFGGWSGTNLLDDTWAFDGAGWTQVSVAQRPPARAGHLLTATPEQDGLLLAGGWNGVYMADAWRLTGTGWVRGTADLPVARAYAAAATDPRRQRVLVHGGIGSAPARSLDDLLEFDGAQWLRIDELVRPAARHGHGIGLAAQPGESILFGGRTVAGLAGDTWRLVRPTASAGAFVEAFTDDRRRDAAASFPMPWNLGRLEPGELGHDGLHGDFEPQQSFVLDTNRMVIPAAITLSGQPETVTDGVFRFSSFRIPSGVTVTVEGTHPLRLHVRGRMLVDGELRLDAPDMSGPHNSQGLVGQGGGLGGPGGSSGGKGGDRGDGLGHQLRFDGAPGFDVALRLGHAYLMRAVGTGGRGSAQFPGSGLNQDVTHSMFDFWSGQVAAGGGGGGHGSIGAPGTVLRSWRPGDAGPPTPGGIRFDPFPFPPFTRTVDHFLIGGSGGGGGGSHPYFTFKSAPITWNSGAGGAGGGGALSARIGADLTASGSSRISVRGGSGFRSTSPNLFPVPGGAGSGGSIVLQVGGTPQLGGLLDATGGTGGAMSMLSFSTDTRGGDGGDGAFRLELPGGGDRSRLGNTRPPATDASVAALTLAEREPVTGVRSSWYAVPGNRSPRFLRYEITARIGQTPIVYSDDPAIGVRAAPGQAVRFFVQGAKLDPQTGLPISLGRWTPYVGPFAAGNLNETEPNGVRFTLLFDRAVGTATIERVVIRFQQSGGMFYRYGSACGAPGAQPSLTTEPGRVPQLGARFPLIVEQLAPGRPAVLHLGASRTQWLSLMLPFDLAPYGAPGCALLASGDWAIPLFNATGRVVYGLDVPNDSRLSGAEFFAQSLLWDPLANPLGFAVSNGIGAVIE